MTKEDTRSRARASHGRAVAWLAGAFLAAALAVPACTTSTPVTATGCTLTSDCAAGLACALGKCRPPCVNASDCPVTGSSCIDDGRSAVCETPTEKNAPCTKESDCPVPLACASDYRCRNLCLSDTDCNVLGIAGRACARDMNGVDYCADPDEVTNGVLTASPPRGAPSTPVIEPEAGVTAAVAPTPGNLIATDIGPAGGTIGARGVTVTVPAGALSTNLNMTIQLSGQPGPSGALSPVFEIGPTGTTFSEPVTIAFDYTDGELAGLSPGDFAVETSTAALGAAWTPLSQIVVDVYAHTVSGQTMHLSPYALVRQEGTPDAAQSGMADSGTDSTTCTNACTAGLTQCAAGAVQTCETQANGCTGWTTTTICGPHQACTLGPDAGLTASCSCAAGQCAGVGTVCQDAQTLATCAMDANGCSYAASTMPCGPMSCSGVAPNAVCAAACTNSCTQGQTSCAAGGLETCTLGSNGCWAFGAPAPCGAHQSCTGAPGSAACSCNADPVCGAPGPTCASATTLATCSTDAQGCVYESATSTCANCSAGACCTNACQRGQALCAAGGLETCTLGTNGCWAYAAPVACGARQTCAGPAGSASCACNVDPVCAAVGTACADSMTLAACSADAQNCVYESATSLCNNGACSAGACCVNTCTSGQMMCLVGTARPVCTPCTLGSNGCWAF
jgi:hypothetical protein